MESLEFYCHDLVDQRPVTGTFLFNQQEHLLLQSKKGWKVYGLRDPKTRKTLAQICIHIQGTMASSPLHAPFGSVEFYTNIEQKKINDLLAWIEQDLIKRGVETVQIKHYPKEYDELTTVLVKKGLISMNFVCKEEVSSIIQVDEKIFDKKIAISQRQKLRKSEMQFAFEEVELSAAKSVYRFIDLCRRQKKQSLSMTFNQLQKTIDVFPDNFILFRVGTQDQLAAAAIVIKVSEKVLYTFYYSHDKKFNKISPVVFLLSGIYQYARQHKFTLLDLGTSMMNGRINKPLLHFKKSVGGRPSVKYVFEKALS